MAFFKIWLGAAYDVPNPLDVWEQAVYNETLLSNPTGIRCAGRLSYAIAALEAGHPDSRMPLMTRWDEQAVRTATACFTQPG